MRLRLVAVLALACLAAGCAVSPAELRRAGPVARLKAYRSVPNLADCIERKMRDASGLVTTYRETKYGGRIDVYIRTEDLGVAMIYEISPVSKDEASVIAYMQRQLTDYPEHTVTQVVKSC